LKIKIREMKNEDAAVIAFLEKECFSSPWSEKDLIGTLESGNSIFLVAESGEGIAGYVGMTYAADEGEITDIAVFPAMRGCGVASLLLNSLFEKGRERGLVSIFLDVRPSNAPAIALYEKKGFLLCGNRRHFYTMPVEDALIYRRDI